MHCLNWSKILIVVIVVLVSFNNISEATALLAALLYKARKPTASPVAAGTFLLRRVWGQWKEFRDSRVFLGFRKNVWRYLGICEILVDGNGRFLPYKYKQHGSLKIWHPWLMRLMRTAKTYKVPKKLVRPTRQGVTRVPTTGLVVFFDLQCMAV